MPRMDRRGNQETYGNVVQVDESSHCPTHCPKLKALAANQSVLVLELDLRRSLDEGGTRNFRTSLGKSVMTPSFLKTPPAILNRLVKIPRFFLLDGFQDLFETLEVVVVIPSRSGPRNLNLFLHARDSYGRLQVFQENGTT